MKAAGAAAEVQVAAHTQAHPVAVDIRAAARSTAAVGNLQGIYGPTDLDASRVGTLRKRPT
jgi:hypothetical protein